MFFFVKVLIAGVIISFASWLSGQYPKLSGFIIALPIASLIAIIFSYYEHQDVEKTVTFTKSDHFWDQKIPNNHFQHHF